MTTVSRLGCGERTPLGPVSSLAVMGRAGPDRPRLWVGHARWAQAAGDQLGIVGCLAQAAKPGGWAASLALEHPETLWGGLIDLDPEATNPEDVAAEHAGADLIRLRSVAASSTTTRSPSGAGGASSPGLTEERRPARRTGPPGASGPRGRTWSPAVWATSGSWGRRPVDGRGRGATARAGRPSRDSRGDRTGRASWRPADPREIPHIRPSRRSGRWSGSGRRSTSHRPTSPTARRMVTLLDRLALGDAAADPGHRPRGGA